MTSKRSTRVAALTMTALLAVGGVAACGSDDDSSSTDTSASGAAPSTMADDESTMTTMDEAMTGLASANFGPGCAAVPATGPGSFDGMATENAASAASANPALSTLVQAVTAANLVDTLNGEGPFTIFAPTNDAFAKIP